MEEYSIKLAKLFDITYAHANYLIQFEEDRQSLDQQRIYRTGCIGDRFLTSNARRAVDRKTHIMDCYNPIRQKKQLQKLAQGFFSTKSVVLWDGKLLPDTEETTQLVDRISIFLTSS